MITSIYSELARIKPVRKICMMVSLLVLMFMSATISAQSQTLSEIVLPSEIGIQDGYSGNAQERTKLRLHEISSSSLVDQTYTNSYGEAPNVSDPGTSEMTANSTDFDSASQCDPVPVIHDLTHNAVFNLVQVQFTTIPGLASNRFFLNIRAQDPNSDYRERLISLVSNVTGTTEDGRVIHELVVNLNYDEVYVIDIWYRFSPDCSSEVVRFTSERTDSEDKVVKVGHNYPNPFNAITRIPFQLAEVSYISVDVYDITGRRVYSKPPRLYGRSKQSIEMNLSDLASGVYIYHFKVQSRQYFVEQTEKMHLIK